MSAKMLLDPSFDLEEEFEEQLTNEHRAFLAFLRAVSKSDRTRFHHYPGNGKHILTSSRNLAMIELDLAKLEPGAELFKAIDHPMRIAMLEQLDARP
jgi:hypothetical protein